MIVLTGLSVLFATGCASSRVMSDVRSKTADVRDSVRVEQVMVVVHDTLCEVTTITITENEKGDTVKTSVVTDRERIRAMYDVRSKREDVRVRVDTMYVAVHDSVSTTNCTNFTNERSRASPIVSALKWIFALVVAVIVLVVVIKTKW